MLVSRTLAEVASFIRPGITTLYLDKIAESFIRDNGATPAFKGYGGFPNTLCTSVNDEVVHGIPSDYVLKEGDIISVDRGVILNGWYGDSAYTFPVGVIKEEIKRLLDYTRDALEEGVIEAVAGNNDRPAFRVRLFNRNISTGSPADNNDNISGLKIKLPPQN